MSENLKDQFAERFNSVRASLDEVLTIRKQVTQRIEEYEQKIKTLKENLTAVTSKLDEEYSLAKRLDELSERIGNVITAFADLEHPSELSTGPFLSQLNSPEKTKTSPEEHAVTYEEEEETEDNPETPMTGHVAASLGPLQASARVVSNPTKEVVAKATREILESRSEPMLRNDLYVALQERGIHISGKNPQMVLSTMLWRAGESAGVINITRHGYWLIDKDYPSAGYKAKE